MATQIPVSFEFRSDQSFDNFLPGKNLELVQQLQHLPSSGQKQIAIWGESHSGKTHLLHACCKQARQQALSSFYLDLQTISNPEILDGLETVELVCIDNIDCIAGQTAWEEGLFGFYNRHQQLHHQLLISSHQAINNLAIQLPDLKTRLNWGLSFKLQSLSEAELIKVLQITAHQLGFELADQVAKYLFARYSHDLVKLNHLLREIDQATLSAQRKLTIPFLKQMFNEQE
jgi:DnaA family protein